MRLDGGSPLGKGVWYPAGTLKDDELIAMLTTYRKRVASSYRSVKPGEIVSALLGAPFHVSPKLDGELWFLYVEAGESLLLSSNGKVIEGDIPLLVEVRSAVAGQKSRILIAGELFAASTGKGRPRVGDVASALAGGANAGVERLGFMAFDLIQGLLGEDPQVRPYAERIEALAALLANGKRARAVRTGLVDEPSGVPALFAEFVDGGKAEGLVIRSAQGHIYKVKPEFTVDTVILGYTRRTGDADSVRSLLLGLTRDDGRTQVAGFCGNLGSDQDRRQLLARLSPLACESAFRCPSSSGDLYTFVRPRLVAEINVTDLQTESSDGRLIRSMVLDYGDELGWRPVVQMPAASWLHPVLVRIRDDKSPGAVDTRLAQLLERCVVVEAQLKASELALPESSGVIRRVWTKSTKDKVAVRKLLVWKSNKEVADSSYPAYVVHWTDYSPGRGTPLEREVRTAPTLELAQEIADKMIEDNIKKGWSESL